jgi:hypothetical protein
MNYAELKSFFEGGRGRSKTIGRPIANNTRVVKTDRGYGIKLYNTVVVDVCPNNTYRLDSGDWRSVTTKERINRFAPINLGQHNFVWYVWNSEQQPYWVKNAPRTVYDDGMVIDSDGKVLFGAGGDAV